MATKNPTPLLYQLREGSVADPFVDKVETRKLADGRVILDEIPVKQFGIIVDGHQETASNNPVGNQFYVDYTNGVLYFESTKTGSVTIRYKGRGVVQIPSDRIFHTSESTDQTLDVTIENIMEITSDARQTADVAAGYINNAQTQGNYAKAQGDYSKAQGDYAKEQGQFATNKGLEAKSVADSAAELALRARDLAEEKAQEADRSAKSVLVTWLDPVNTYADIFTVYPNPIESNQVQVLETGDIYRFENGQWNSHLFSPVHPQNMARHTDRFIATQGQTVFNTTKPYFTNQDRIDVYISGVKQASGIDFNETSPTRITLTTGCEAGEVVEMVYLKTTEAQALDLIEQVQAAEVATNAATTAAQEANTAKNEALEASESTKLNWKDPVANFAALTTTYPTATKGWTSATKDNGKIYRHNGTEWKLIQEVDLTAYNALDTKLTSQLAEIAYDVSLNGASTLATDNTSVLQDALNKYKHVKIGKAGTYITRGLTIKSNTTFELGDGVVLKLKDNTSDYIIKNENWMSATAYDYNIRIYGGKYDINGANNPRTGAILQGLYAGIGIVLNRVKNLEVRNIKEIGNGLKYCFLFANIENGVFENINCINESDGLHFQAPCKNIKVHNLTGTCHDNLLPFTIGDYPEIALSENGDFDNIDIKNIYSKGETIDIIRFVGDGKNGSGRFRNITIDNVQASCPNTGVIEIFNNDQASPNVYLNKTIIDNIKVSNIKNNSQTKRNIINIWGEVLNLTFNNLSLPGDTIAGTCISIFNSAKITNLSFNDSYIKKDNNGYVFLRLQQQSNVANINFSNCNIDIKGNLIDSNSDVEHNVNIENSVIGCNRFAVVTGKLKVYVNNVIVNFLNPTTIANNSKLFLEGEKTIFNSSGGQRFRVDFGATDSKMRVNSKDIVMTITEANLQPSEGDYIKFFNDLSVNRKKGLYQYRSNKYIFIDGELTFYKQALDFGTVPANSSVVRDIDISELGSALNHDYRYGVIANAYNGTGETNNITYCSWLKDNTVKIRVSNLSNTAIAISCDWLIKIIK